MRASLLTLEGEPHARLRRLVSQAFAPRAVDRLHPTMCAVAHDLLDAFATGACEFMAAFADPYPARVIAALLGIPPARYPQFQGWATDLGLLFGYTVARDRARIEAALEGLAACADDLLAARRAAPGPDLLSALIAAEEAGDRLSDAELWVLVTGLVFADQDTTRNRLGGALTLFLAHPAQ
jgi:cytochrome P450